MTDRPFDIRPFADAAPPDLVERLRRHGYDDEDARSRAALLGIAEGGLRRVVPTAGSRWRWIVPGRVEVFGKHTDYAGGRSILATVPRGIAVVAAARQDAAVRVIDARHGESLMIDAGAPVPSRRGWSAYVATVVRRLAENFPGASLGADIAIASDLPRAAGLSSSSALIVGIATALIRRARIDERDEWRRAILTPLDLAAYLGCVENGRTFRTLPGGAGVGTEGGSEDHTAILSCRPGAVSQFAFAPIRHLRDTAMPADWRFAIASSGVHADKTGSVREQYNRASRAVQALLAIWNRAGRGEAASLADALGSARDAAETLRALLVDEGTFRAEDLSRRLTHFINENGRVPRAAMAFQVGDADALGALARASQADAETLLGNQVPETVALVEAARTCGAYAASSFGAGFGGSVWSIVPAGDAARFGEDWITTYRAAQPALTRVESFVARPGPPLVEL